MKSRKERRTEARENGTTFEPQYKGRVITKAQYDQEVVEAKEAQKNLAKAFNKAKQELEEVETTTEEATQE